MPLLERLEEIFVFVFDILFLCTYIFTSLQLLLPLPGSSLCPEPDVVYTGCCYCFVVAFGLNSSRCPVGELDQLLLASFSSSTIQSTSGLE